jgi:two-component system, NarL family, nitrate/nitrite response regulator NarL
MPSQIRVAILDNHQSIIDGYIYRLTLVPSIQIVASAVFGEELEPMIASHEADILLMELSIPVSAENHNPFPVLYLIPRLLQRYPNLRILIISVLKQWPLVEALMETGICGYIFKDDQNSIEQLARIVNIISNGGVFFSKDAYLDLLKKPVETILTRQYLEVLSLCATFPENDNISLASMLGIAESTLRNHLSSAYLRLGVGSRTAAVAKAQQLGILPVLIG